MHPDSYSLWQRKGANVHAFLLDDGKDLTLIDTLYDADARTHPGSDRADREDGQGSETDHHDARSPLAPGRTVPVEGAERTRRSTRMSGKPTSSRATGRPSRCPGCLTVPCEHGRSRWRTTSDSSNIRLPGWTNSSTMATRSVRAGRAPRQGILRATWLSTGPSGAP